jgi:hypothetical protein
VVSGVEVLTLDPPTMAYRIGLTLSKEVPRGATIRGLPPLLVDTSTLRN